MLSLSRASLNTATLGHRSPIASVIDAVARHGFGGIAPWRRDLDGQVVTTVARQIRDAGLAVSSYCRSTYLPAASREQFERNVSDNRVAIDQAAVLGASAFVMVVGSLPTGSKDLDDARRQVVEGCAALREHARGARRAARRRATPPDVRRRSLVHLDDRAGTRRLRLDRVRERRADARRLRRRVSLLVGPAGCASTSDGRAASTACWGSMSRTGSCRRAICCSTGA